MVDLSIVFCKRLPGRVPNLGDSHPIHPNHPPVGFLSYPGSESNVVILDTEGPSQSAALAHMVRTSVGMKPRSMRNSKWDGEQMLNKFEQNVNKMTRMWP